MAAVALLTSLTSTLALQPTLESQVEAVPMPLIDVPPAAPLRFADGQLLLLRESSEGAALGRVDGGRILPILGRSDAEVSFDACSQTVLPWRPSGSDDGVRRDLDVLRRLLDGVRGGESPKALLLHLEGASKQVAELAGPIQRARFFGGIVAQINDKKY